MLHLVEDYLLLFNMNLNVVSGLMELNASKSE